MIGGLVVAGAVILEVVATPPWWVHLVWVPISFAAVIGALRVTKGLLIAAEYRNQAREGRLAQVDKP